MHPEVTRDKNYHDYHSNDGEDIHFISSSCGTVHFRIYTSLKTKQNCLVSTNPLVAACHGEAAEPREIARPCLCPAGFFILRHRRGVTRRINANGGNRNSRRRQTERQAQR